MKPENYQSNQKALHNRPDSTTNLKCRYGNSNIYYHKDAKGRTIHVIRPAFVKINEIK